MVDEEVFTAQDKFWENTSSKQNICLSLWYSQCLRCLIFPAMVRSPVIPTKYLLLIYSIVSIFYKKLSEAFLLDGSALSEKKHYD